MSKSLQCGNVQCLQPFKERNDAPLRGEIGRSVRGVCVSWFRARCRQTRHAVRIQVNVFTRLTLVLEDETTSAGFLHSNGTSVDTGAAHQMLTRQPWRSVFETCSPLRFLGGPKSSNLNFFGSFTIKWLRTSCKNYQKSANVHVIGAQETFCS